MTLDDLVQDFRDSTDDLVEPYLWSAELVESYADRAEKEACCRRPLLTSSSDDDMCKIQILESVDTYTRHPSIREVYYAKLTNSTNIFKLYITNIDELAIVCPDWESLTTDPRYLLLTDGLLQVVPKPSESGILELSVSHVPKEPNYITGELSISEAHHSSLVYWMLHLAYEKKDADTFNVKKSLDYAQQFANVFGDQKGANAAMSVRTVRSDRDRGGWI